MYNKHVIYKYVTYKNYPLVQYSLFHCAFHQRKGHVPDFDMKLFNFTSKLYVVYNVRKSPSTTENVYCFLFNVCALFVKQNI